MHPQKLAVLDHLQLQVDEEEEERSMAVLRFIEVDDLSKDQIVQGVQLHLPLLLQDMLSSSCESKGGAGLLSAPPYCKKSNNFTNALLPELSVHVKHYMDAIKKKKKKCPLQT